MMLHSVCLLTHLLIVINPTIDEIDCQLLLPKEMSDREFYSTEVTTESKTVLKIDKSGKLKLTFSPNSSNIFKITNKIQN